MFDAVMWWVFYPSCRWRVYGAYLVLFFTHFQECTLLAPLLRNVHLQKDIIIILWLLKHILSNGYKSKVNELDRDFRKHIFDKFLDYQLPRVCEFG